MEKRISVFIGRTIFFACEKLSYKHFDWLYGFLTSEENRIVILLQAWPPCLGRRERVIWLLCQKEEEFFQKNMKQKEEKL